MLNYDKPKYIIQPTTIIDVINGNDPIYKMIRLYIYKILYNNYKIGVFINKESINKYKLNSYADFSKFIKNDELINIFKIDYRVKTLEDDYFNNSFKVIEKYKKENFQNINLKDFNIKKFGIDNFYVASYNLTLSNLQMENSNINKDFYDNICEPLFKKEQLLLKAIKLFYEPKKYNEIKNNFGITSNNIKALLFGYRFCLNEIASKNENGIYYPLYDSANHKYLIEKLYPGNDTKRNIIYSNIINHFRSKPDEGCYVCLCKNGGYYHSVPSGFPGSGELNMKCPKCNEPIGSYETEFLNDIRTGITIVKRENYYRIFKDEKEIEEIKKDKEKKNKMKEINYLILEQFKEKYIYKLNKDEKGVCVTDKNNFKNDEKIIRHLSHISYRLLNYILYIHLFFARIITNKKENFKKYLPKGMDWVETLYECWNILENELLKENIYSIEKFMYYIFIDLFPILNKHKNINDYEDLIKFENELESIIQKKIKEFKGESIKNNIIIKKSDEDKTSFINLLKEKYPSDYYDKKVFPFYEYFYYTDYLNETYINEKLKHMDESKYPVLSIYLNNKINEKPDNNKYSLNNLSVFNNALNLIREEYLDNITRENAKKKILKNEKIYNDNMELFNNFIKFYNNLEIKDTDGEIIELDINNSLCNFFLSDDNDIGRTYIDIYKNFIKEQNEKIGNLLDMKIEKRIFDDNCKNKINIQQINENEIFTLNFPKKISFIDILFNSSYRKILDSNTRSYESYKEYEINYDLIEEKMTDLLLKNKKLLNEDIIEFIYNNEVFSNQLTDLITIFNKRYIYKNINIHDKVSIYKFSKENKNNINICKKMNNDFITLIKFLNNKRKEDNNIENNITEESKIYQVLDELKDQISPFFLKLFENNDGLTIEKTSGIFEYYLKLIYEEVKKEIKNYQEKLNNKSIEIINNYYQKEHLISKKDFAYAIRLFITLVLLPEEEEEKENKIKNNHNNIVDYLKGADFWKKDIYDNEDFNKNLNELKLINAQINQIISLYEILGRDIEDNFCDDVKEQIENEKSINNENNNNFSNKNDDIKVDNNDDGIVDNNGDGNVDNNDDNDDDDNGPFGKKDDDEDNDDDYDPFGKKDDDDEDDEDNRD